VLVLHRFVVLSQHSINCLVVGRRHRRHQCRAAREVSAAVGDHGILAEDAHAMDKLRYGLIAATDNLCHRVTGR
jgi:hypothetical protein